MNQFTIWALLVFGIAILSSPVKLSAIFFKGKQIQITNPEVKKFDDLVMTCICLGKLGSTGEFSFLIVS